jgi:uncharacterized membrane protein YhaH (DUF805 family)
MLPRLFSFEGKTGRLKFALISFAIFLSQHALIAAAAVSLGRSDPFFANWWFGAPAWYGSAPPRSIGAFLPGAPNLVLILLMAYMLIAAWAFAALAFQRATDAGMSEWIAAFAIVPVVQIGVFLFLCVCPSRGDKSVSANRQNHETQWRKAAKGVISGIALTLFAVALGALVFGSYGYGIFVVTPFVVGLTTAWFANQGADIGAPSTLRLALLASLLGGIALVVVALEGIVCIVLAAPIGAGMAAVGGLLGRAIAVRNREPRKLLSVVGVLPVVFALECILPPSAYFETEQTIMIDAPPAIVWKAIVTMRSIEEPPGLPFRLGMAYPLRGEVVGEGVGAQRRGEFSTGTAVERVTEWVPERKLAFVVVNDVPAMRELSPYEHVHAPHVSGYFRTVETSFELVEVANARTRVIERTSHELRLDPVPYWLPLARLIVSQNNGRVMRHVKQQAEADRQTRQ